MCSLRLFDLARACFASSSSAGSSACMLYVNFRLNRSSQYRVSYVCIFEESCRTLVFVAQEKKRLLYPSPTIFCCGAFRASRSSAPSRIVTWRMISLGLRFDSLSKPLKACRHLLIEKKLHEHIERRTSIRYHLRFRFSLI